MEFDWDEVKRQANLRRHRVDFAIAAQIFKGPAIVREDARRDYGERRFRAVGKFEGQTYVVAYTLRNEICHIITAWKVGKAGERRYQAVLARRAEPDA